MKMEIRPAEGGADAQAFAQELATAVGRHAGVTPAHVGTALVLDRL